ncbi:hypothetical protein ACS5PN_15060 [Roseateles sp. NT4]|uniref:hypothetical protein n=1 Tax=Roseateles sp. NT4 TaxID=3453715 RepID=UPI003EEF0966
MKGSDQEFRAGRGRTRLVWSRDCARLAALAAAMLASSDAADAVTNTGSWGKNRLNQTVVVNIGDIITFKNDAKGHATNKQVAAVAFEGECAWVGESPVTGGPEALDCRQGKSSPLTGAYFRIRFSETHSNMCRRGTVIYECVQGCEPRRVPRLFVEEPEEC